MYLKGCTFVALKLTEFLSVLFELFYYILLKNNKTFFTFVQVGIQAYLDLWSNFPYEIQENGYSLKNSECTVASTQPTLVYI